MTGEQAVQALSAIFGNINVLYMNMMSKLENLENTMESMVNDVENVSQKYVHYERRFQMKNVKKSLKNSTETATNEEELRPRGPPKHKYTVTSDNSEMLNKTYERQDIDYRYIHTGCLILI